MINSQTLKEKLLDLCQKIYPLRILEKSINFGGDTDEVWEFAKRNRLAHYLALGHNQLFKEDKELSFTSEAPILEYNDYKKKIKNSLKKIKQILNGKEFMIIKTFSSFPHLTSDIDVLVKDLKDKKFPIHIEGESLWPIHIEKEISWMGADAISNDFAWQNTKKYQFANFNFLVPSAKLAALLRIAHIPFEQAYFRLAELLYIYNQIKDVDWNELKEEASRMGWPKTFEKLEVTLEILHSSLFGKPLLNINKKITFPKKPIDFPYKLSLTTLAGGVIERRAWIKIYGARYVIKERIDSWLRRNIH